MPTASLIFDQTGNLYGTAQSGGSSSDCFGGCGVAFKLASGSGGWSESVLYNFCSSRKCGDGASPYAGLTFDGAGNLYGTTVGGGSAHCALGCGVAFKLAPNSGGGWSESVVHRFCSLKNCRDGRGPIATLIFDQTGNLYGTTHFGGSTENCPLGCGLVFKLTPNSNGTWHETELHEFRDHPGTNVFAGLTFDSAGNLYGTTFGDETTTFGTVFEITP